MERVENKLYAWIFLCISKELTPLHRVLSTADGINRAEPRLNELQAAFGWLQAQALIKKEEKQYIQTEIGIALRNSVSNEDVFTVWDAIAERFSQLPEVIFQPDEITEKDILAATKINRKLFRDRMSG